MNAELYGPRGEILVDNNARDDHLSNLTRAVLMLLVEYSADLQMQLRDGLPPVVRAHLQEKFEAIDEATKLLLGGAVALGFIDPGPQPEHVEVPH